MKIKDIEAIPLVRVLDQSFEGGTYTINSRNTIVTRVVLDNGVTGLVFGGDEDAYQLDVCNIVNRVFCPLLVGGDVRDVERHWQTMWHRRINLHNRGIHTLDLAKHCAKAQAMAAVDLALWDALGKSLRQPVYKLLGGYRDAVPVIAIGGYVRQGKTMADLESEVAYYRENGIGGMKLKVGKLSVEEDIIRTRAARKVAGDAFHLCVDSNQAWTAAEAIQFAAGVRDLNLAWMEEPIQWHDQILGNARLRQVSGIPVCAGQGEIGAQGCRDLIVGGAIDVLNVDITISPGLTEWRRIAGMANAFGVTMAHHEEPQVALHALAGVSNGRCVEIFPDPNRDPMWFDLPVERPKIESGKMFLPAGPGFGIDLREDVIARWRVPVPKPDWLA